MAPPVGKRKRGDRAYSYDANDGSNRPSPHRPQNLHLAQHGQYNNSRGGRRGGRGGPRGYGLSPRSPVTGPGHHGSNPNASFTSPPLSRPTVPSGQSDTRPALQSPPRPPQQEPQAEPEPTATPRAYAYNHVTDDTVASWNAGGEKSVVDAGADAISRGDDLQLSEIFQQLIVSGLDRRLDPTVAGNTVKTILSSVSSTDYHTWSSVFLDTLSIRAEIESENPSLRTILFATEIPPAHIREVLETPLLVFLGLIRSTFPRMSIRKTTNLLYRQSNYNLLREETEGYSKLLTEYFNTIINEPPSGEVVKETFERTKALIGAFDLDVGRVLDVTLDVFANLLVKHYRFFIKFLRISSWWPQEKKFENIEWVDQGFDSLPRWALPESSGWASSEEDIAELAQLKQARDVRFWQRVKEVGVVAWFELGKRRVVQSDMNGDAANGVQNSRASEKDQEWISATNTLPPSGNYIAAQLLGFKLRFYASDARSPQDVLPDNLIFLAALLIKIGFISLKDLYPHLYPPEEKMPELKDRLMKERAEREKKKRPGGGAMNALMMAGALADDTIPGGRYRTADAGRGATKNDATSDAKAATTNGAEDDGEQLPEPADQKTQLLKSLLCIGAIPDALFILGRSPWMADAYPDLPDYIHRILHHSLAKVYEPARPLAERSTIRDERPHVTEQSSQSRGQLKAIEAPPRKTLRWPKLDKNDTGDGIDYRFYWDDWDDNVPVCQTVDDVFLLCRTFLNISGVKIGKDINLLEKLIRIGTQSLADDKSPENFARWLDLSKRILIPSLSMTESNAGVVREVYDLIKMFSTKERYSIYSEWFVGQTSRNVDLKAAFDQARAETKDILKRISKTNTRLMARNLAKVALGSPGIVFNVVLNQIESYENLIDVVVECARYFTQLGYDVLIWALLSSLGGGSRNRMQGDGILTSSWLRALSLFAGRIFKRYSVMNPTPVLQYVAYQLRSGTSIDLEVLEQMITIMAGIRSDITFNENQTLAMAGGEVLQMLTLEQLHDKRFASDVKHSSKRLVRSLVDQGLASQILIAIAQERQMYIFRDSASNTPLKVLGSNLDKISEVFIQYLEMLRSNLSVKDYDAVVPSVISLMSDFGIEPAIAFAICRPSICYAIAEMNATMKQEKKQPRVPSNPETPHNKGDVDMIDAGTADASAEKSTEPKPKNEDVEMKDDSQVAVGSSPPGSSNPAPVDVPEEPWHPVLKSLMNEIKPLLADDFEETLSVSFYVTFWQLSLSDLLVPSGCYDDEQKRQREKIMAINADRSDLSSSAGSKKQQKKNELNELVVKLNTEMKSQIHTYSKLRARLQKEKDHWFSGFPNSRSAAVHTAIIQECFFPRVLLSATDAQYVFKMILSLHSSGTPGFRTMHLVDLLFEEKRLTNLLFLCSTREAENLGRFLNELLKELRRWHSDQAVYEKVAHGPKKDLPGFAKKLRPNKTPEIFLEYEDYRRLLYKWHRNLNGALKTCLTSGEYMHIKNAIILLKGIHQNFPLVNFMGVVQLGCVTDLSKKENREDLKLSALSLLGDLKKREKHWVLPQAFHLVSQSSNTPESSQNSLFKNDSSSHGGRNVGRGDSARPNTPQPGRQETALNATAPDFKPTTSNLSNGIVNPPSSAKEVEDGEIEDAKNKEASAGKRTAEPNQEALAVERAPNVDDKAPEPTEAMPDAPPLEQSEATTSAPLPSTAAQSQSAVAETSHPDEVRDHRAEPNISAQSALPRTSHALPNRPDTQFPRGRVSDRPGDRIPNFQNPRQDTRRQESQEYGRLDRPGDLARDSLSERHEQSPARHSRGRTPERGGPVDRDRRDQNWSGPRDQREYPDDGRSRLPPRDTRPPGRDYSARERPSYDPQSRPPPTDSRSRMHGNPPFNNASAAAQQQSDRGMGSRNDRAPYSQHPSDRTGYPPQYDRSTQGTDRFNYGSDRPAGNFERETPTDSEFGRRNDNLRPEKDGRWDRSSRPHSPSRGDERGQPTYSRGDAVREDRRDERGPPAERLPPINIPQGGRERHEDFMGHTPTGPRGDRGGRHDFDSGQSGRSRELFQQPMGPPAVTTDVNHGRLNQDPPPPVRTQQDPNYGRLNANAEPPSGPRARPMPGRGGRNFSAQPPHSAFPGPVSPAGFGGPDHNGPPSQYVDRRERRESGPFDQTQNASVSGPPTPVNEQSPAGETGGIHPSRLGRIGQSDQSDPSSMAQNQSNSPFTPSGPRGPNRSADTAAQSFPGRNVPAGPPLSGPERRMEDKRFAGIQNYIQQGSNPQAPFERNDRGASVRGRATRGPSDPSSAPPSHYNNAPAGQVADRVPSQGDTYTRNPAPDTGPPGDLMDRRSMRDAPRREGDRRSASGRHRRSRSRSPSRDKRPDDRSDYRDRRGPPSDGDQRRESSRRGRDDGWDRDRESSRRDMRPRDDGGGPPPRRSGPPMEMEPPHWGGGAGDSRLSSESRLSDPRNGDGGRMRGGQDRRDDRERRDTRESTRDVRKRGRPGDEVGGQGGEAHKRPRRAM